MKGKAIYFTAEELQILLIMLQRIELEDVDYELAYRMEKKVLKA